MTVTPKRVQIGGGGSDITCNTCGAVLPAGTNPCTTCQRNPADPADPTYNPTNTGTNPNRQSIALVGMIVVVVLGLIVACVYTNGFGLLPNLGSQSNATAEPTATVQSTPAPTAAATMAPTSTSVPQPTEAIQPSPTSASQASSKGIVLFQFDLLSSEQQAKLTSDNKGWTWQSFGSSSTIPLYDEVVKVAATKPTKLVLVTSGRDAASKTATLKDAIKALRDNGIKPVVIVVGTSDEAYYALVLIKESSGTAVVVSSPNDVPAKIAEALK